jgi:GNAT superfamily N-acetyltransferase
MIDIKQVTTKKELKQFVDFIYTLYDGNPYWAPPLRSDELNTLSTKKNPASAHCESAFFLAFDNSKVVGRIGLILNHVSNEKWNQSRLRFTRVDFIDDLDVSRALFTTAENWARKKGLAEIQGPLGYNDLDQEGMLVEGFDELDMFITIYNHPYYVEHLEKLGYIKDTDWLEYQITIPPEPNAKVARLANVVNKRYGYQLLSFKTRKEIVLVWADKIFDALNEAYAPLYGMVPLTAEQVQHTIDQFISLANPDFIKVVVDKDNQLVGFGIAFPSLTNALRKGNGRLFPFGLFHLLRALKKNDRLDLYLVAVQPELQGKGINALLMDGILREAIKYGMTIAETGPELEDNSKVQAQWKFFDTRQHRRRRCWVKNIANEHAQAINE